MDVFGPPALNPHFKYKGREIEIIAVDSGFYCKWDSDSTHIAPTTEAAIFLAEKLIDAPELYCPPKADCFWNSR